MKIKTGVCFMALGVASTLLYQNIKNGNLKKLTKEMNSAKTKMIDELESML